MYWYLLLLLSVGLLVLIFVTRRGLRKKYIRKSWIEHLETIARDNHTLWSTHLPYSQKERLSKELKLLEKKHSQEISLKLNDNSGWLSNVNLLQYPSVKRLFTKLLPTITAYSRTLGLDPKCLTITAKARIEKANSQEKDRQNENALFSGSYFLEAHFEPKAGVGPLAFYKKDPASGLLARFHPHAGDLLLYPSDMEQEMISNHPLNSFIRISFDVHFGNRKKSWLISKVLNSKKESSEEIMEDFFYERSGEDNYIANEKVREKAHQFFHISKIKKKF